MTPQNTEEEKEIPEVTMVLGRIENITDSDKRKEIEGLGTKTQGIFVTEFSSGSFVIPKMFSPESGSVVVDMETSLNKIDRKNLITHMKKLL